MLLVKVSNILYVEVLLANFYYIPQGPRALLFSSIPTYWLLLRTVLTDLRKRASSIWKSTTYTRWWINFNYNSIMYIRWKTKAELRLADSMEDMNHMIQTGQEARRASSRPGLLPGWDRQTRPRWSGNIFFWEEIWLTKMDDMGALSFRQKPILQCVNSKEGLKMIHHLFLLGDKFEAPELWACLSVISILMSWVA